MLIDDNQEKSKINKDRTIIDNVVLCGIGILLLSMLISAANPYIEIKSMTIFGSDLPAIIIEFIAKLLEESSIAIIISAVLIFMIETNHYKQYFDDIFEQRVIALLINDSYLERLNQGQLNSLKKKIDSKLLFRDTEYDKSGLWSFLNNTLSSWINECYFDEYDIKMIFNTEKKSNETIFIEKIVKHIKVVNPTENVISYKIPVNAYAMKIDSVEDKKELYQINSIELNGNKMEKSELDKILYVSDVIDGDESTYDYKFTCDKMVSIQPKESLIIDIEATFLLPSSDKRSTFRVVHPCKKYTATICMETDQYDVDVCPMVVKQNAPLVPKIKKQMNNKITSVSLCEWTLPGEGMTLYFSEKYK